MTVDERPELNVYTQIETLIDKVWLQETLDDYAKSVGVKFSFKPANGEDQVECTSTGDAATPPRIGEASVAQDDNAGAGLASQRWHTNAATAGEITAPVCADSDFLGTLH